MEALDTLRTEHNLTGEVIVADNGSDDGSQTIATGLGARVVGVTERGYGAALIGGISAAPNALATADGGTIRFFGILQGIATPIATVSASGRRYFDLDYSVSAEGTFVIACADTNGLRVIQLGDFTSR